MRTWIVTAFESSEVTDAAIVEAEGVDAAALTGAEILQGEWETKGDDTVQHVFVAPFDVGARTAYRTGMSVTRAPLQCCGGPAGDGYMECDGHYATCPERPEGTGQPRHSEGVRVLPQERGTVKQDG